MSIYTDKGYENRKDYIQTIADDYGVDLFQVVELATLLGPEEDFDGLISMIDELAMFGA